ncbi:MAG TPA: 4-(cytidine 5'-diphospho)-2-C-methyl-D-erythritol kinase [Dehalococcoidia bacterium]|nr:4-(cytidine 5'-diphospho)-2-C-methyl-D-erythritol kinase [Dehalococcoidia bacterium]
MAGVKGKTEMLTVMAPAKLNLTLEVLDRRNDGFHEIRSVVQTIDLCDRIVFRPGDRITFKCHAPGWLLEESLVSRAAALLKDVSGHTEGASIDISKKIPLLSGLGGDSSDAAAILIALSRLWKLACPPGELARLASQLGSDVAFFLFGGTALMQGRGEVVSPLPPLPGMWVVLLVPDVPRSAGKTGRLYDSLKKEHYSDGQATEDLVALLTRGGDVMAENLCNAFECVAYDSFEGLGGYRQRFLEAGAGGVHLAGSGPALFSLFRDKAEAEKVYASLKKQKLEAYLAETMTTDKRMEQVTE